MISAQKAIKIAKRLIIDGHKEHFIGIYLRNNKIITSEIISIGTLTASLVYPREVFRPALVNRTTSIIILHNHPSRDVSPSEADIEITTQLKNAGQLLGIVVLDHIIFEKKDMFWSFRSKLSNYPPNLTN